MSVLDRIRPIPPASPAAREVRDGEEIGQSCNGFTEPSPRAAEGSKTARVARVERSRSGAILVIALVSASLLVVPALADVIRGTQQGDRLVGTQRADKINARKGDDVVKGKRGADFLIGGAGDDRIVGGPGFDEMRGGGAADVINARDGIPDTIICGRGVDRALVDEVEDGVFDCEEVIEP